LTTVRFLLLEFVVFGFYNGEFYRLVATRYIFFGIVPMADIIVS